MHNNIPANVAAPTTTAAIASDVLAGQFILVRVTVRKYGDSRKDSAATEQVLRDANASSNAGRFTKKLFAKAVELDAARSAHDAVRTFVYGVTLPWVTGDAEGDKRGPRLLPLQGRAALQFFGRVQELEQAAQVALDELCRELPNIIERVKAQLGTLFDPNLYPDEAELRRAFGVTVSYDAMPTLSDLKGKMLPATVLDTIIARKEQEAATALQVAQSDIAERVTSELDRLARQLGKIVDGDTVRLHESLVTNLQGLVPLLDAINIDGDHRVEQIIDRIRSEIVPDTRHKDDWKHSAVLADQTLRAALDVRAQLAAIAPSSPDALAARVTDPDSPEQIADFRAATAAMASLDTGAAAVDAEDVFW